jgi:hypothetical protein
MRFRKAVTMLAAVVLAATLTPAAALVPATGATAGPVSIMAVDDLRTPDPLYNGIQYLGTYYLENRGAYKCLDAPADQGGANNRPLDLWECNQGPPLRWQVYYTNRPRNPNFPYWFENEVFTDKCVDYPANSGGANNFRYNTYACSYTPGQMFQISAYNTAIGGRLISVELGGVNNVMDAFANGCCDNGRPVGNWVWTGHALQHWHFQKTANW